MIFLLQKLQGIFYFQMDLFVTPNLYGTLYLLTGMHLNNRNKLVPHYSDVLNPIFKLVFN